MRKIAFTTILTFLFLFILYIFNQNQSFEVLEVFSPDKIGVDINKNRQIEENEIISVKINSPDFKSSNERFIYDYFSTDFAKNLLEFKKVKLNKTKSDILLDNQEYSEIFNNQNFDKIKSSEFRILNLKSNKYHEINCKYGQQSQDYIILQSNQIPEYAIPCKYCHQALGKVQKPSQLFIENGEIQFFITDFSKKLKSDNNCSTELCKAVKSNIDSAKNTIDIALYGYGEISEIQKSILNAIKRGVEIRLIYDLDQNNQNYYADTFKLVEIVKNSKADNINRTSASSLMHNKFFIIDKKIVITGSANISAHDMSGFNSNSIIVIQSNKIARIYENEFNQMFEGKFHTSKQPRLSYEKVKLKNSIVSVYFSPQDKAITNQLIPLIDSSKKNIYLPTFLITYKGLAEALIKASNRGVRVKVIIDATNARSPHSQHEILRKNGIQVKTENFAGKMHSKSIIIDETYVIIGSMNFSKSGEQKNDENVIILENPTIANFYKNYFEELWIKIPNKWLRLNARAEGFDSIGSCTDGIDNNFDGKTDKADPSCN